MVNEYINQNYYALKKKLRNTAKTASQHEYEDLFHHCLLIFMEHRNAEQAIKTDKAQYFLARIMLNQYRTNRSDFVKYKNKHVELTNTDIMDEDYSIDPDYYIELILSGLDEMIKKGGALKNRALIIIYYYTSKTNFNEVERRYGIKSSTARHSFNKGMEDLKKIINNYDNELYISWDNVGHDYIEQALRTSHKLFKKETKLFKKGRRI